MAQVLDETLNAVGVLQKPSPTGDMPGFVAIPLTLSTGYQPAFEFAPG